MNRPSPAPMPAPRNNSLLLRFGAPLAVVLALAVMGWVLWGPSQDDPSEPVAKKERQETPATVRAKAVPVEEVAPDEPAPEEETTLAAGVDEDARPAREPSHPITPTHERIYRENNLNGAMAGAMHVGDYLGLRALVEEYRMDYPEDSYRLQEGYSIIADCLEKLTEERQETAREYWKTKRGSLVRRFIRRHCLDKAVVAGPAVADPAVAD